MPDNPLSGRAGNLVRAKVMLDFFEEHHADLQVEFFSVKDWGDWSDQDVAQFQTVYPHVKLHLESRKNTSTKALQRIFLYKIPNFFHKLFRGTSVDISGFRLKRSMKRLIEKEKYDIVVISYAVWGALIENLKHRPYLINDTHDFISAQSSKKTAIVGKLVQSEINILKKFDELWTYSVEEQYIFEQFTQRKVKLLPVSFPQHPLLPVQTKKFDLIFVGSQNPHNVMGIKWFIDKVFPLLPGLKVHIIGKVCENVQCDNPNVVTEGMVEDLSYHYNNARIAICPMLSGTGVKIKVLEALSYNLPVVTNRRGVDGLVNKSGSGCLVTNDPQKFAGYIQQLMTNDILYDKVRSEGRNYFTQNHLPQLEKAFMNTTFLHEK